MSTTYSYEEEPSVLTSARRDADVATIIFLAEKKKQELERRRRLLLLHQGSAPVAATTSAGADGSSIASDNGVLPLLHELRGLPQIDHSRYQPLRWPLTDPFASSPPYRRTSTRSTSLPLSKLLASHHSDTLNQIQELKSVLNRYTTSGGDQGTNNGSYCPSTRPSLLSIPYYPLSTSLLLPHEHIPFSSQFRLPAPALPPYGRNQSHLLKNDSSRCGGVLPITQLLPGHQHHQVLAGRFFDEPTLSLPPSYLSHLVSAGGSKGISRALPSISQHSTKGSTMLSSSGVASSTNATTLFVQRSLAEKLIYNPGTKMTPLFFKEEQRGTFPVILHQALLELTRVGDTSTATFLPDGKSFAIHNQYLFEARVIPVFFPKMKGFASFQRQLNLYDFICIRGTGLERRSYHHEFFHRDVPSKVCGMKRTKIKGGKRRRRRSASSTISTSADEDKNSVGTNTVGIEGCKFPSH